MTSKLYDFYKAKEEKDNLVIIPSGYVVGKSSDNTDKELILLTKIRKSRDDINPRDSFISITLPYDKNIYNGNFSENELSHPPRERAEMIYEAISTKNDDGSYKYNNIYFTGGSNTEDVIFELDKLCKEKGPLPQRKDNLKTYGFSDATQLHHYLGQRGISTPVYYSKGLPSLIVELEQRSSVNTIFELTAINEKAEQIESIDGYLQPGNQTQVEDKMTHQTALFDDNEKYNFMVVEFGNTDAAEAFLEICNKFRDKKIALLLSKDTDKKAIELLKEKCDFPIFTGMPVGHGKGQEGCLTTGKGIALFSGATLIKTEKNYELKTSDVADDKVKQLNIDNRRHSVNPEQGNDTTALLLFINGSSGAVFENLDNLQVGSSTLHIKIPEKETDNIIQTMEMSIKKLYEKGVIKLEAIKYINFECPNFNIEEKELKNIERRLIDLKKRYLPELNDIKLNEKSIISHHIDISRLRGISPAKNNYLSQQRTEHPRILPLRKKPNDLTY